MKFCLRKTKGKKHQAHRFSLAFSSSVNPPQKFCKKNLFVFLNIRENNPDLSLFTLIQHPLWDESQH